MHGLGEKNMKASLICGQVLCLLYSAFGQPDATLEAYNSNDAIRGSNSVGGLVSGEDKFILHAAVNRNSANSAEFANNSIVLLVSTNISNPDGFVTQSDCSPDLSTCDPNQSGCYCRQADNNGDFHLVLTIVANIRLQNGGAAIKWNNLNNPTAGVTSTPVAFPPVICETLSSTYAFGQGEQALSGNKTLDFSPNLLQLTFCANGLKSPDVVKIDKDGVELNATTENCVTAGLDTTPLTTDSVLTLSFEESSLQGCGRQGFYIINFQPANDDVGGGLTGGEIAGIVIGVIVLIVVIILVLVYAFKKKCQVDKKEEKVSAEIGQEYTITSPLTVPDGASVVWKRKGTPVCMYGTDRNPPNIYPQLYTGTRTQLTIKEVREEDAGLYIHTYQLKGKKPQSYSCQLEVYEKGKGNGDGDSNARKNRQGEP